MKLCELRSTPSFPLNGTDKDFLNHLKNYYSNSSIFEEVISRFTILLNEREDNKDTYNLKCPRCGAGLTLEKGKD